MSERRLLAAGAVLTLIMAAAGTLLLGTQGEADSSSLSRTPGGWLAARRYLEEMGTRVVLVDHDLDEPVGAGVLVLAFPWQRAVPRPGRSVGGCREPSPRRRLHRHRLHRAAGADADGTVGEARPRFRRAPPTSAPGSAGLARLRREEWVLMAPPPAAMREVRVSALREVPRPPTGATVLLHDGQQRANAFVFPRHRGRVDGDARGRVRERARRPTRGTPTSSRSLRQDLGGPWWFDEYHHGLRAAPGPAQSGPQRALLLYVLQVGLVYALCAFAVVRRFGPAWREEVASGGSAATFLVGLGALHDRLGHHREAARLIVARAQELDPRVRLAGAEAARRQGAPRPGAARGRAPEGKGQERMSERRRRRKLRGRAPPGSGKTLDEAVLGQRRGHRVAAGRLHGRRPCAARRRARDRQDAARSHLRRLPRPALRARPVHAGRDADRPHRHERVRRRRPAPSGSRGGPSSRRC